MLSLILTAGVSTHQQMQQSENVIWLLRINYIIYIFKTDFTGYMCSSQITINLGSKELRFLMMAAE